MAWVRVPWRRLLVALTAGGAIGVPMFIGSVCGGLTILAWAGKAERETRKA